MIYKLIKESIKSKNKAISLLLDSKAQCQTCKHCVVYHLGIRVLKRQISNSNYYRGNMPKYRMKEEKRYFCRIKNHDVLRFAQCKKFDFQLDVG